jgi:hypothetical protein
LSENSGCLGSYRGTSMVLSGTGISVASIAGVYILEITPEIRYYQNIDNGDKLKLRISPGIFVKIRNGPNTIRTVPSQGPGGN